MLFGSKVMNVTATGGTHLENMQITEVQSPRNLWEFSAK